MIDGLISTIIPVFNRAAMLREAVESVLAQTYRPIEIVIIDDGSTDETGEAADSLARERSDEIICIRTANRGPGLAREAGRQIARGEFIQYLDSDDLLLPDKFRLQVAGLRENPQCGVSYGKTRCYHVDEAADDIALKRTGECIDMMFPTFLQSRWWSTSTPLYRKAVTDQAGPWTGLRNEEDWEHDCRIAALGVQLHFCGEFVSETRNHADDRLSCNGSTDPKKLRDRSQAHRLIYTHARQAGIGHNVQEMRHFARELFLICRQCGAAGLAEEAEMLFDLARRASGEQRGQGLDFKAYAVAARFLGWQNAGKLACMTDRFRP